MHFKMEIGEPEETSRKESLLYEEENRSSTFVVIEVEMARMRFKTS